MRILAVDVGGSKVKALLEGLPFEEVRKVPSGPDVGPREVVAAVRELADGWDHDVVSMGYPGPVQDGRPARDPVNLGAGWAGFDFEAALGRPVRVVNDAAMQALGSYEGGKMLFLGLGTGLGTALVQDGVLVALEAAHLPYRKGRSFEDYLGEEAMDRRGKKKWNATLREVVAILRAAFVADYVVLGGGNVKHVEELPAATRRGANANAFVGGFRLWRGVDGGEGG